MPVESIKYLHACYEADNGNKSLWNIHANDIQHLRQLTLAETAVCQVTGAYSVDHKYGEALYAAVATYRREKTLLYASHFIIGSLTTNAYGKPATRKICAPLFLYDAECVRDNGYQISIDINNPRWNYTLLYALTGGREHSEEFERDVVEQCDPTDTQCLLDLLNKYSNEKQVLLSAELPAGKENFATQVAAIGKRSYLFVPASAVMFISRSMSSRGIIDELTLMAGDASFPAPIIALLGNPTGETLTRRAKRLSDFRTVPGLLSDAQKQIMYCASRNVLSLLIGPPGTGKSYTIASLALERFMQGESVLVVSQNEHAVDVIRDKIVENFGLSHNAVMRAGTRDYHSHLKKYLDEITQGRVAGKKRNTKKRELNRLISKLSKKERAFEKQLVTAQSDGQFLYDVENGKYRYNLFAKFRLWRLSRQRGQVEFLHDSLAEMQSLQKQREALLAEHIDIVFHNKLHDCLKHNRQSLTKFRQALGAKTSLRQEQLFTELNFTALLEAMPIWLCSLAALHRALPLKPEMFDLVIIDEATQCDVASCLPALYRARRVLVVGDPKQLRHVSFLSRARQGQLLDRLAIDAATFDISYRDDSLVDVVVRKLGAQESVVLLNEHYRSTPNIINFSNRRFYDNRLRIMTEKPGSESDGSIEIIAVENGQRINGVNETEAQAILEKLRSLVDEQAVIPAQYKLAIGVLSFFREQAEYIQDLLFKMFTIDELVNHKLRAGTPYAFQGEERDIMLISCGVDDDTLPATYTYLNRPDVFNVGVTRARELQLIFLSAAMENIPATTLLQQYLSEIQQSAAANHAKLEHRNEVIQEFAHTFSGKGYTVLLNYAIAGIEMDLVLIDEGSTLAVDLVGFPGEEGDPLSVEHYRVFERAGLAIHPVCYMSWCLDRQGVIQGVSNVFVKLKEANTIQRLTAGGLSYHWTKLLASHSVLAHNVREIEADLIAMKLDHERIQLGELIDQYHKTLWVLNEKLNPTELTFIRYSSSAEQVFLNGIENLSRIVMLVKSIVRHVDGNSTAAERQTLREEQQSEIERLYRENSKAVAMLEELALNWSKTNTRHTYGMSDMDEALQDLQALSERTDQY
ncbi:MAG: DNA2/NAM7 family helicase [Gammaproteobacteria bacterium]|nr:DNA2/NAM7 family helicase [Gammaproteobacteria bacterium]MDH5652209.1 DNA2/NAM7 family helicase [Gammaproteobacteria bacterium]